MASATTSQRLAAAEPLISPAATAPSHGAAAADVSNLSLNLSLAPGSRARASTMRSFMAPPIDFQVPPETIDETDVGGDFEAPDPLHPAYTGRLGKYFAAYKRPHKFSDAEFAKMRAFESIEYWPNVNRPYQQYLRERREEPRYLKWAIYALVGFTTGLWAVLIFHSIDALAELKAKYVNYAIDASGLVAGYFAYLGWSVVAAAASTLCCVVLPTAAGSGVPDVMAFLNGVMTSGAFRIQILVMKSLSTILAVNSGLPVGAEGPMIHIGAIIGGGISSGRSRSLQCGRKFTALFRTFHNRRDQRDFVAAGSAAGVASVFSSPLGGLLFVMEEVASFFPVKLAWMVFTCCLCCYITQLVLNTYFKGFSVRQRTNNLLLDPTVAVLFNVNVTEQQYLPFYLLSFLPAIAIGAVMAVVAWVFIKVHLLYAARIRGRYVGAKTARKVLEPILYAVFFASLWFWLPQLFPCQPIPGDFHTDALLSSLTLYTTTCKENRHGHTATHYNPMATLTMTPADNAIKTMMVRHHSGLFPPLVLAIYFVIYTLGAACTAGSNIASGVVIPTFVIGCSGGRLLVSFLPQYQWADAGLMAIVGTAGFFSGTARLTFSLLVIIVEVCNDVTHILLVMAAIATAKVIGDRLCHSLYHEQIARRGIPFLDSDTRIHKLDTFSAKSVMTKDPVCLSQIVTVSELWDAAKLPHSSFPVVANTHTGKMQFRGVILRDELSLLLWHLYIAETDNVVQEPPLPTFSDLQEVEDMLFWDRAPRLPTETTAYKHRRIDLSTFVDRGTYCVAEDTCISRTYGLFRSLGLRRVVVVDSSQNVVGILTRRNLVGHCIYEGCRSAIGELDEHSGAVMSAPVSSSQH